MTMPATTVKSPDVLCLHGSASSGRQWRRLIQLLGRKHRVHAPNLIGYGSQRFDSRNKLRLDDEVDAVLEQLDDAAGLMHVVGHAYGGAVALRLACRYPERVASLTLYEPAQFLSVFEGGLDSVEARELRKLHTTVVDQVATPLGRWRSAREFVNYGYGRNVWKNLTPLQKSRFATAAPKVAAEFDALMVSQARLDDVSVLTMPVRILCGTRTRRTAKRVCELLSGRIPGALVHWLDGLKHMAPITDAGLVNTVIAGVIQGDSALMSKVA